MGAGGAGELGEKNKICPHPPLNSSARLQLSTWFFSPPVVLTGSGQALP